VRQAVDALLAKMRTDDLAESTITTAEFRLWHFFDVNRNGNRPLRWLNNRGEELYAAAREGREANTHQAELALAKQLGDLCVKRRWLRVNPFAHVEPVGRKTHGSMLGRLRVDEARKLQAYCLRLGDQYGAVTLAYLQLGSRASEVVDREVRDLDDDGYRLVIDRAKTAAGVRSLAVPPELRRLLRRLASGKKPTDPLFTREDGEPATRYWAYHHVRRVCADAGVPVTSPQGLRRTQSDAATDAGVASIEVARHLGQRSERVTNRSYRDRTVTANAKASQAWRVLQGGRR
jgi:integrase